MRVRLGCILGFLVITQPSFAAAQAAVDVELVLAADTSSSMKSSERRQQVDGYARAFRDADLVRTLLSGPRWLIAVAYVEWDDDPRVMVPWALIASIEDASRFADAIASVPTYCRLKGTNITAMLAFGSELLESNRYDGLRRVIDVSGDGPNNSPVAPDDVRNDAPHGATAHTRPARFSRAARLVLNINGSDVPPILGSRHDGGRIPEGR